MAEAARGCWPRLPLHPRRRGCSRCCAPCGHLLSGRSCFVGGTSGQMIRRSLRLLLGLPSDHGVVRGVGAAEQAGALAEVVGHGVTAIVTRVEKVGADLRLVLRDELVKLEEDLEGALVLLYGRLILYRWVEQAVLGQIGERLTLGVLRMVYDEPLLVGV